MRKVPFVNEEIYHIYNRGVDKRDIFSDSEDVVRFLTSMNYFNTKKPIGSIYQYEFHKNHEVEKLVEILAYNILPNHFHFILKQKIDGGISEFMKRLLGGYTNYFNDKNDRSGSLFQGKFKSIHIDNDEYFSVLLGYVTYNNLIHDIPETKKNFIKSSITEIETGNFYFLNKSDSVKYIQEKFGSVSNFKSHCKEIVKIIRQNRGKELLPEEYLFDIL